MTRVAIIGFGYWGPNLARNINLLPNANLSWICDLSRKRLRDVPRLYPKAKITTRVNDIFKDPHVDAVAIATPPSTHVTLASLALRAGKHVLVEKPLAPTAAGARSLVRLARERKKILMVDHTYIYTPAVQKIKRIIRSGKLGEVFFIDSVRTNLGLFQKDSNVISDLAAHDFSIVDFLFDREPREVSATGFSHASARQEAVAYVAARYKNLFLHTHVSWLSPVKIRTMIFVGTKKMLLYDDIEPSEKIRVYDKGVSVQTDPHDRLQLLIGYRTGSIVVPHLPISEGLAAMVREFVHAIQSGRKPISDGGSGIRVVRAIESATISLRSGGKTITL